MRTVILVFRIEFAQTSLFFFFNYPFFLYGDFWKADAFNAISHNLDKRTA